MGGYHRHTAKCDVLIHGLQKQCRPLSVECIGRFVKQPYRLMRQSGIEPQACLANAPLLPLRQAPRQNLATLEQPDNLQRRELLRCRSIVGVKR